MLLRQCEEIGHLLGGMISKAEQFCATSQNVVREETAGYFVKK